MRTERESISSRSSAGSLPARWLGLCWRLETNTFNRFDDGVLPLGGNEEAQCRFDSLKRFPDMHKKF